MKNFFPVIGIIGVLLGGYFLMGDAAGRQGAAGELANIQSLFQGEEVVLEIAGSAFAPQRIEVKRGTTVTWVNNDATRHNAVADDGSFRTPLLPKGGRASVTFRAAGSFPYSCGPHPFMRGEIVVKE